MHSVVYLRDRARAIVSLSCASTRISQDAASSELKWVGSCDTGEVFEQQIQLSYKGKSLSLRRILVQLNHPTRHGDSQVVVLTNLPPEVADGLKTSQLYLVSLHCSILN